MQKSNRGLIILIMVFLVGGLAIFLFIKVRNGFKNIQESYSNDAPITNVLTSEDSAIILKDYWDKIKVDKIINFKQKEPISILSFDRKYYLIINKIILDHQESLQDILHKTVESVDRTTGEVYSIFDLDDLYKIQYLSSNIKPASGIFLTLSGDSLRTVINDSIASFNLLCDDFSIRFSETAPISFYVNKTKQILRTKPSRMFDLLFLKRGLDIYFFAMTPINPEAKISPDLVHKIIVGL